MADGRRSCYDRNMNSPHPQLAAILRELEDATAHTRKLAETVDEAQFQQRPATGAWSIAECLAHLNLTTRAYLPLIDEALKSSQGPQLPVTHRYRRDLKGWLLGWAMEPPFRMKIKTTAPFVPSSTQNRQEITAEFEALQNGLAQRVADVNGCDLGKIKLASPFDSRMKYNLYACLRIIPAHQRRHLWQADNVLAQVNKQRPGQLRAVSR
jgi:hypothetical protein